VKLKKEKIRTFKVALTFLAIGLLLGAFATYAATPSSTFTISGGVYPGAPSYTIWEEDSNYFAKNSNGKIEFSGSNASQLLQNAINNGDVIFVKAGTYLFDAVVTLKAGLTLIGEGIGVTIFKNNFGGNMFRDGGVAVDELVLMNFEIDGAKSTQSGGIGIYIGTLSKKVVIKNIKIKNTYDQGLEVILEQSRIENVWVENCGGAAGKYGVGLNIRETNVDKLYVYNSFNQGVKIYSASCNSTISNSIFEHNGYGSGATAGSGVEVYGSHITFINCFFIDNYGAGVLTASTSLGFHTFTGCHAIKNGKNGFSIDAPQTIIVGCTSVETGRGSHTGEADAHGVQFTATAIGSSISASTIAENFHAGIDVVGAGTATNLSITIQGNIIYDNGNTSIFDSAGIHVNSGANKVFIIGNTIFDNDSTYQQYAIILDDANTSDITIYDNDLRGNTVQAILETADFAGSFEVEGNLGFVTENSGSFSNVVNGTTIAHGLAGTPTTVVITLSTQGYAWYAADATYITLYFSTSTASGSWYAKYKP